MSAGTPRLLFPHYQCTSRRGYDGCLLSKVASHKSKDNADPHKSTEFPKCLSNIFGFFFFGSEALVDVSDEHSVWLGYLLLEFLRCQRAYFEELQGVQEHGGRRGSL